MGAPLSPAVVLTVAIMAGASMDATIKHLAETNPVLLVVLGRYVFGAIFSWMIYARAGAPEITAEMWRAHLVRGAVMAMSGSSFFWALTVLPLAEAVALSFIYPLIVPFVAWLLLRERIRLASMAAALVGFAGVVIAAQGAPSAADSPLHAWGVAAVLWGAATFALAMVLLRQRAQTDPPEVVAMMSSVAPGIVFALPALVFAGSAPNWADWPGFLLMGVLAAVFMLMLTYAYANAEAQRIAPIHYTELIWASLLGYYLFHETPRVEIYFGAALIIAACLYVAYDNRRLAPLPPKEPT